MTFVVSALTQHEVIQLSDRRFTYTKPGKPPTYDDEQNKAVLFCGRLMFAFTGIGDLGMGRETDLWLAARWTRHGLGCDLAALGQCTKLLIGHLSQHGDLVCLQLACLGLVHRLDDAPISGCPPTRRGLRIGPPLGEKR